MPFLLFFLAFSIASFAQQAYRGGSGDGYASATISSVTLDINGNAKKPSIEFSIFPNPAASNQLVSIQVNEEDCRLGIYTMEGKTMASFANYNSGMQLPILPAGTYLVKLENEDAFSVRKLIVLPAR